MSERAVPTCGAACRLIVPAGASWVTSPVRAAAAADTVSGLAVVVGELVTGVVAAGEGVVGLLRLPRTVLRRAGEWRGPPPDASAISTIANARAATARD